MNRLKDKIWFITTVIFAVCLTIFTLYHMVIHPWKVLPELGGDGAKNSFTYLWHSMYDKGYWFNGMNYPYGEHIVYTDGIPAISVLLTCFANVTQGEALTVLWLLIGFSYVLSIVFIYKILLQYKVHPLVAMLFAGLIGIFTPQLLRLRGHYALSFTCIIPMLFYWTIKYTRQFKWRYPIYFFIIGCFMSFIHPYYAGMMLVWVLSYSLGYILLTKERLLQKARFVLPLFVSVLMVIVVVGLTMKITDPVTDRPETPFSTFYETCTRIKQIITSAYSPIWQSANGKPKYYFVSEGGEGYAYIGIAVALILAMCFIAGVMRTVRERRLNIIVDETVFSPVWLFMAASVLLFSMGVPFIWHMQGLLNYLSFFKQFRSLGRFSWIFYYIITVYAVVVIYSAFIKYKAKKKFVIAYSVLLFPFGLWCYEASGYVNYSRKLSNLGIYNYAMIFSLDEQNWESYLEEHHYNKTDFQAILVLPFFHVGTEKLWVGDPNWLITLGSKASLQLRLPIIDVMMSRSSWSQAQAQVKIAGGPFTSKPLLDNIKSNKPFLLMHFENDSLNPDQKYLLDASDYIGHRSQCYIYACYPGRLAANDRRYADSIKKILPFMKQADTVIGNNENYCIDHLDTSPSEHFFGPGVSPCIAHNDSVILSIPIRPYKDSDVYEFSFWALLGKKNYASPFITLQLVNSNGKIIDSIDVLTNKSTDSYGMWFRAATFFRLKTGCTTVRCKLVNDPNPAYVAMDEIQLRPANTTIISKGADGRVLVNNHLFAGGKE
jgi:hypothetical protein